MRVPVIVLLLTFALLCSLTAGTNAGPRNPLLTREEERSEWGASRLAALLGAACAFVAGVLW